jgi:hypothetical protein
MVWFAILSSSSLSLLFAKLTNEVPLRYVLDFIINEKRFPQSVKASTKSVTVVFRNVLLSRVILLMLEICLEAKRVPMFLKNFFSKRGTASVLRLLCPIGYSTSTFSVLVPSLNSICEEYNEFHTQTNMYHTWRALAMLLLAGSK